MQLGVSWGSSSEYLVWFSCCYLAWLEWPAPSGIRRSPTLLNTGIRC